MCAPYLEKLKLTFLPWLMKRSSVHLIATLSNLNRFQYFLQCQKPVKMYETKRAFTYLILKESVANDVINVSLFAHDTVTLKTQNVNKRRQDVDKNFFKCLAIKKYGVKRLIKEFPNKKWIKRGVEDFQKRLWTTGSIERAPSSERHSMTRTAENVDAVRDLDNQPQTHRSTRQISRELGIP